MEILKRTAPVILLVVLLIIGAAIPSPQAAPAASLVTVTNTPLPVQGGVSATQSGAWTVGISGTPTVQLAAGTSIQLQQQTPEVFRHVLTDTSALFNTSTRVLVIEVVAGSALDCGNPASPTVLALRLFAQGGAGNQDYFFQPQKTGSALFHELTKIYMKPGEVLSRNSFTCSYVTLSGHYE